MIHKKRKKNASFRFSGHAQGWFRLVSAVFRPVSAVSAVSAAGRYVPIRPIWPIRPDFGWISPIRRESKPIWHESSRIGANRAESARIREKKKKKKKKPRRGPTRGQPRRTPRPASDAGAAPLVPRPCILDFERVYTLYYSWRSYIGIGVVLKQVTYIIT